MALGLAGSGALRWGRRHRRTRGVLLAWGLNLAAIALTVAIFVSGTEPGGMAAQWRSWLVPSGVAFGFGLLFRFPRSVGLPVLLVGIAGMWLVVDALREFRPGTDLRLPMVQPLTDGETVTAFALQADLLALPGLVSLVPEVLVRLREPGEPVDWWWPAAVGWGWARSAGATLPSKPMKYGVYRLTLEGGPAWHLEQPEEDLP